MSMRIWETIVSNNNDRTLATNTQTDHRRTGEGHSGVITTVTWSKDVEFLASGCSNCYVKIWKASSFELVHTIGIPDDSRDRGRVILHLLWSPDDIHLVTVFDSVITFWNRESFSHTGKIYTIDTKDIKWTMDNKKIITQMARTVHSNNIAVWDCNTYSLLHKFDFSSRSFALSPILNQIAFSYDVSRNSIHNECMAIASIETGRIEKEIKRISKEQYDMMAWSPKGDFISTIFNNVVRFWDPETLTLKYSHKGNIAKGKIISFCWSPDGNRFAFLNIDKSRVSSSSNMEISVIDFTQITSCHIIRCDNRTECIKWLHESKKFISICEDMTLYLWDTDLYDTICTVEGNQLLNCVSLSHDSNMIAFGGNDRIIIQSVIDDSNIAMIIFKDENSDDGNIIQFEDRKCPRCRREISYPYGYKGFPDIPITCAICYEDFTPIIMTTCGHFLCEICFRNPQVFGFNAENIIDDLSSAFERSMIGIAISPREQEYIPYSQFRDNFVIYGRYPNSPDGRDANETIRRKDVIIKGLQKYKEDPSNNRISAQLVMDLTFYCDPPRSNYPLGFLSPDNQTTHIFRRSVVSILDIPDWQSAIISLYKDLTRRV